QLSAFSFSLLQQSLPTDCFPNRFPGRLRHKAVAKRSGAGNRPRAEAQFDKRKADPKACPQASPIPEVSEDSLRAENARCPRSLVRDHWYSRETLRETCPGQIRTSLRRRLPEKLHAMPASGRLRAVVCSVRSNAGAVYQDDS